MIEREVLVPKERPLVAAVIYNRLAQGIPLGIDATLRYDLDNFDKALTVRPRDRHAVQHPQVPGLPPTPIANPGLDSLKAAADRRRSITSTTWSSPGSCGEHYFTRRRRPLPSRGGGGPNSAREAEEQHQRTQ